MAGIQHVGFRFRHIALECLHFGDIEDGIVSAPDDQGRRMTLAQPLLPRRIFGQVGAIIIKQLRLDVGLTGPRQEGHFIHP